jgi:NitT/TauT family transport system substrate-binding protein
MKRNAWPILQSSPLLLVLGLGVAGTSAMLAAEPIPVSVAISNTSSDVQIFIAEKKGYFAEEGLAVTTIPFDSGAMMMAPMGAGDLDVGSGSATAGSL